MTKPSLDARLFQVVDIKQIAANADKQQSLTTKILMGRAGQAAYDSLLHDYPNDYYYAIFCGNGGNGADGLYLAAIAALDGKHVDCYFFGDTNQLDERQTKAYEFAIQSGVHFHQTPNIINEDTEVVIDAIMGLGYSEDLPEDILSTFDYINQSKKTIVSLDVPSGLNPNTGAIHTKCIQANLTISFIAPKIGCYTYRGPRVCGKLITNHLGIEPSIIDQQQPVATLLSERLIRQCLPKRKKDTHKGDYGNVLVIGGDYGMGGAVRMAAEAAMRAGAGSVTVATRPEHLNVVSGARPEIMCFEVREGSDLEPLIAKAKVIVLGPGLGQTEWAKSLFDTIIKIDKPKVMDADALHLLSELPIKRDDWILTPHPGEAAQLLKHSCPDIQDHRLESVKEIQHMYGGVVVLKGLGTLVNNGDMIELCHAGNPGMATAGMGDILSGVLGGLLAQGLTLSHSASVGVLVHARSADMAAKEKGERGLLATDLLPYLRQLVNP